MFTATPLGLRVVLLYMLAIPLAWLSYTAAHLPPLPYVNPIVSYKQPLKRIEGEPARIDVPSAGISLPIIDGSYDRANDTWTLTDDKAQFARMTTIPNSEKGTTFIYGHNTDAVFAKLASLKPGDSAILTTTNGHTFEYTFGGNQIVNPTNTSVLNDNPSRPQLVLMTCEGILSQTRRVMYFDIRSIV